MQLNVEAWESRKAGELSNAEFDLALYVAFECDFRTGRLIKTLAEIEAGLGWNVTRQTMARRLARVRNAGFVVYDVTPRQHEAYVIQPTARLLKAGRLATQACTRRAPGIESDAPGDAPGEGELRASDDEALPLSGTEAMQQPMHQPPIREEKRRSTQTAPEFPRARRSEPARPLIGDDGYGALLAAALSNGHAMESEARTALAAHEFVRKVDRRYEPAVAA